MSAVIPDPAVVDWVPLGGVGGGGSMIALQEIVLAADGPIDFTNIPQGYAHLRLLADLRSAAAAGTDTVALQCNAGNAGHDSWGSGNANGVFGAITAADAVSSPLGRIAANTAVAGVLGSVAVDLLDYASARYKFGTWASGCLHVGVVGYSYNGMLGYKSANPVTRVTLLAGGGTFKAGSRATLLGVAAPGVTLLPTGVRAVWGRVSGAGAILGGTGFTVSRSAAGQYTVTFNTPFANPPAVIVKHNTAVVQVTVESWVANVTANGFAVQTTRNQTGSASNFTDYEWHFIAMEAA